MTNDGAPPLTRAEHPTEHLGALLPATSERSTTQGVEQLRADVFERLERTFGPLTLVGEDGRPTTGTEDNP
jgi:hypothetical protein